MCRLRFAYKFQSGCLHAYFLKTKKYKLIVTLCFYTFQELKRERSKAALAIKSLQEKMEEKLKMELEQKVVILVLCWKC